MNISKILKKNVYAAYQPPDTMERAKIERRWIIVIEMY